MEMEKKLDGVKGKGKGEGMRAVVEFFFFVS